MGVESHKVDGNDPLAVYNLVADAAQKCRSGKGPILIEAKTYRHMGHHVNDPGKYMPAEKLAYYKGRDPVDAARKTLSDMSDASDDDIAAIEASVIKEIADAIEFAVNSDEIKVEEFRQFADVY